MAFGANIHIIFSVWKKNNKLPVMRMLKSLVPIFDLITGAPPSDSSTIQIFKYLHLLMTLLILLGKSFLFLSKRTSS